MDRAELQQLVFSQYHATLNLLKAMFTAAVQQAKERDGQEAREMERDMTQMQKDVATLERELEYLANQELDKLTLFLLWERVIRWMSALEECCK